MRFAHSFGLFQSQFLLVKHMQVLPTANLLKIALTHAVLLLARERKTHVNTRTFLKTFRNSFDFQFSLEFSVPLVKILLASLVIQVGWHHSELVPSTKPTISSEISWRVQHGVVFVVNMVLDFFVGGWTPKL